MKIIVAAMLLVGCGRGSEPLEVASTKGYNGDPATMHAAVGNETSKAVESQLTTMPKQTVTIERRTVYFSGTVQGVGFRATAAQLSQGLPLAGEVRNLDDGRVELVVEGEPGDIDAFVSKVREHFRSYIRSIEQSSSVARGMPQGVRITY